MKIARNMWALRKGLALAMLLFVGGCLGTGGPKPQIAAAVPGDPEYANRIGALPPRKLEEGSCGLFLWAKSTHPQLVFFSESQTGAGQMVIGGKEETLNRVSADQGPIYGHFMRQTLTREDLTVKLNLSADENSGILRGVKIPKGIMRFEQQDGWQYILPVAGMIACKD